MSERLHAELSAQLAARERAQGAPRVIEFALLAVFGVSIAALGATTLGAWLTSTLTTLATLLGPA